MENFTIKCVYDNKDILGHEEIVLESVEQHILLEIRCGGIKDNNSFTMEYYGDEGIIVTRNRCKLDVYLSENKTYYDKNYTIICTHANDADVFVAINLLQKAGEFALNVIGNDDTVTLQSIVDSSNSSTYSGGKMYYEEKEINLDITGGSKKYRVVGIYKCYDDDEIEIEEWTANKQYYKDDRVFYNGSIWRCIEDNTGQVVFSDKYFEKVEEIEKWKSNKQYSKGDRVFYDGNIWCCIENNIGQVVFSDKYFKKENNTVHRTTFDNGFILKKNTNSIVIRNYGRPFIDEKYYYIIVLEHFDVRDIKKEIIIKYTSLENSTITKKLRKNVGLKSSKPKIIMPIIQEEKQEKEDIVEIKPIEYGLEMLENVEDYTIIGEPVETILPFTVTEDGIESNLMVKASSSAYWCRVKVIQEYNDNDEIERKLIFRITNKPLIIRKTRITVSIIDLPDVNVSFIITNKPS